jgi:hypothetical protein
MSERSKSVKERYTLVEARNSNSIEDLATINYSFGEAFMPIVEDIEEAIETFIAEAFEITVTVKQVNN